MSMLPKEVIRELIREKKFESADDILETLKGMFREVLQETLEAELDEKLGYDKYDVETKLLNSSENSRNGYSKKTLKTQLGNVELDIPRDRNGEYEPQIIPKHKRNVTGIEEKVLALYAAGMTTRDIHAQIRDLYDVEISAEMVSKITDRVLPLMQEWQNRPLESVYPFVFLDAIHYKVREDKQIVNKAAYVAIGVNTDGCKDVLGIWIGGNETSKFWLGVLNELKNRGVSDVLIFCVDGLTGLCEAIETVYPMAKIQRCIIHQLRASMKYVSHKDKKAFAKDLKEVYTAPSEECAIDNLISLKNKWDKKYPNAIKSWETNWNNLSTFFAYPPELRRIIYTTNVIESLHSQFRKVTKTKLIFPTDESLQKMLYLATMNVTKKWTIRYRDWDLVIGQLSIQFEGRLDRKMTG